MPFKISEIDVLRVFALSTIAYNSHNDGKPDWDPNYYGQNSSRTAPREIVNAISAAYVPIIVSNAPVEGNPSKGHWYVVSGSSVKPKPIISNYEDKVKVSHPNFHKAKRDGQIVINPYSVRNVKAVAEPGLTTSYTETHYVQYFKARDFGMGLFAPREGSTRWYCTLSGFERWNVDPNVEALVAATRLLKTVDWVPSILPLSAGQFSERLDIGYTPDTGTITATSAEANKQSLDLSTLLAELPQTMSEFSKAGLSIMQIVKDLRSKNLSLTHAFKRERDRLGKTYSDRRVELERELIKARHPKRIKYLNNKISQIERNHQRALLKSVTEFNDAVADLWLWFRYSLTPIIYTVEDVVDAQVSALSLYNTSRDRLSTNPELPILIGWKTQDKRDINERCMIKRRYQGQADNPLSRGVSSTLSFDIIPTIWELIPYSFIIDWFVNIGDVLAHNYGYDFHLEQGCTYSFREEGIYTYTQGDRTVKYYVNNYVRLSINPDDYAGFCFDPTLNVKRVLDSLALSWRPLKRQLLKSK